MNRAVILLGTNTGNLSGNLERALLLIEKNIGKITLSSRVYETEPWGFTDQPNFYNQVIEISTFFNANQLMDTLLETEIKMGRERKEKWAPRIIDLDILYFNDETVQESNLSIPHPRLHERRFTLEPLTEILPDMVHPVLMKNNKQLLAELTDKLNVSILNSETRS
jgi:2-amino-4-hydroxy-6-hydroxymethyldihydropteridine diphosphokinase